MNPDQTAPTAPVSNKSYISNPFVPALNVLSETFKTNGIAYLQVGALILATFLGAYLLFVASLFLTSVSALFLLLSLAAVVAFAYFSSRLVATLIHLWIASMDGTARSWREAYADTGKYVLRLVGLAFLLGLILIPAYLLLVVPGLFLTGRLALAVHALVTEDLSILGAIRRSWRLSRSHAVEILGAIYAGTLMGSNGLVGFGYMPSSSYGRYRQLVSIENEKMEKPKIHWLNWLFVIALPVIGSVILVAYIAIVANAINSAQDQLPQVTSQELYK